MQLTIRDVSKFLQVTDSTVVRWIKQRGLPSHSVGGRHHFNRVELLEWATANRVKVRPEELDQIRPDDEPRASLVDALENGGVFQIGDTNKELALAALVAVLPLPDTIDRELLLRLFLAREASARTAVGDGIALPHIRNPIVLDVAHPMVTVCFLNRPVDFGALDGKPVHVLFCLICPTMRSHLQTLSRLSFALHDPAFKTVVLGHGQREQILREARRIEASMAAGADGARP